MRIHLHRTPTSNPFRRPPKADYVPPPLPMLRAYDWGQLHVGKRRRWLLAVQILHAVTGALRTGGLHRYSGARIVDRSCVTGSPRIQRGATVTLHRQPVEREPSGRLGQRSVAPPAAGRQPGAVWRTRSAPTGVVVPLTGIAPLKGAHRPIREALATTAVGDGLSAVTRTSEATAAGPLSGPAAQATAAPRRPPSVLPSGGGPGQNISPAGHRTPPMFNIGWPRRGRKRPAGRRRARRWLMRRRSGPSSPPCSGRPSTTWACGGGRG